MSDRGPHSPHHQGAVVKSRNEPGYVRQVLDVIAGVKGEEVNHVAEQIYKNTCEVFFPWLLDEEKKAEVE